jgi:tol-pal system protein YbgF
MKPNPIKPFLVALSVLVLGGCVVTPPEEDPVLIMLTDLERRLESIERVVQNQSLVKLTQQVSSVERRGDELQGRVEELEHSSESTAERQRQLYVDIDTRMQELEAAIQAQNAARAAGNGTPQGRLAIPGGSDRDNYQAAFELLKEQSYGPAALAFQQFLTTFPDSELADNAQYWLAESHYVTQNYNRALGDFEVVIDTFPNSRKVPDALLKIGYCNYELERWDDARESLTRVQTEYADSTAARLAGQRLQRMDEEGV